VTIASLFPVDERDMSKRDETGKSSGMSMAAATVDRIATRQASGAPAGHIA